jgi:hypothetical protein
VKDTTKVTKVTRFDVSAVVEVTGLSGKKVRSLVRSLRTDYPTQTAFKPGEDGRYSWTSSQLKLVTERVRKLSTPVAA